MVNETEIDCTTHSLTHILYNIDENHLSEQETYSYILATYKILFICKELVKSKCTSCIYFYVSEYKH